MGRWAGGVGVVGNGWGGVGGRVGGNLRLAAWVAGEFMWRNERGIGWAVSLLGFIQLEVPMSRPPMVARVCIGSYLLCWLGCRPHLAPQPLCSAFILWCCLSSSSGHIC